MNNEWVHNWTKGNINLSPGGLVWGHLRSSELFWASVCLSLMLWKCFVDSPDWLGVIQGTQCMRVVPSKSCLCSSARHSATGITLDHITSWGEESRPGLSANTGYSHNLISYEQSLNNQHTRGSGLTKVLSSASWCSACIKNVVAGMKSHWMFLEFPAGWLSSD